MNMNHAYLYGSAGSTSSERNTPIDPDQDSYSDIMANEESRDDDD